MSDYDVVNIIDILRYPHNASTEALEKAQEDAANLLEQHFVPKPRPDIFPLIRTARNRNENLPDYVLYRELAPFEHQALKNHGQTLQRLAERGGMSAREIYAVCHELGLREFTEPGNEEVREFVRSIGYCLTCYQSISPRHEKWCRFWRGT